MIYRLVFFFKRKTAYEMRISDWSSDVCSSDLIPIRAGDGTGRVVPRAAGTGAWRHPDESDRQRTFGRKRGGGGTAQRMGGRARLSGASPAPAAADRKLVATATSVDVVVNLGGRSVIKKKNKYITSTQRP